MTQNKNNRAEIEKRIDIIEDDIANINPFILELLLKDKTTRKNILWCTKDYEAYGPEYDERAQIFPVLITGRNGTVIQPRAAKTKAVQLMRVRKRAEVFTPSWICNAQNNQIDNAWFGRENVFNTENGTSWTTNTEKISFAKKGKTWKAYVYAKRLEITCGEAPYLVSRYDTTTGDLIPLYERIGLFDRKMRVVNENCTDDADWIKWSICALRSVYGYEFQGDSLLIARENLFNDYIDYYKDRFGCEPDFPYLRKIVNIIVWNIWQMDGLKCVVPYSCHETAPKVEQVSLDKVLSGCDNLVEEMQLCPGCVKKDIFAHNGTYCRIYDWTNLKKSIPFISIFEGGENNGKI